VHTAFLPGLATIYLPFTQQSASHTVSTMFFGKCMCLPFAQLANAPFTSHHSFLTSYIAYMTNPSFVFNDYVWSHLPLPYTLYDFALRPTHMPLNAFIAGPSTGGDVPPFMHRAISARYFDYICPPSARAAITYSLSFVGQDANGLDIGNWWRERFNQDDDSTTNLW
jgi:hypothetical protein